MNRLISIVIVALLAGCPEAPPRPSADTGLRDAGQDSGPLDAPGLDADLDAAGMDGGAPFDAPLADGVSVDTADLDVPDDVPKDAPVDALGLDAPGFDAPFGTDCVDSRQCRGGHACTGGVCVDRRVHCGLIGDCPYGFFCDSSGAEPYFCQRLLRPCVSAAECPVGTCSDLDGDGDRECVALGACDARTDCPGATTCLTLPVEVFSECGSYGACASATDCGSGRLCVDLWGDGVRECVDAGGCSSTASCPGTGICGTPATGGPPACLNRPLP